jgi:hypothetical protein
MKIATIATPAITNACTPLPPKLLHRPVGSATAVDRRVIAERSQQ